LLTTLLRVVNNRNETMEQYEMSAYEALSLARRRRLLSRNEQWGLSRWLGSSDPLPSYLRRAVEIVYLLQTRPPTPTVH
jgi:hypothetical protein